MWEILETGAQSAQENMATDAGLLSELRGDGAPILHFYDWAEESATYGYFSTPSKFLDLKRVKERGICLAKRPTGGGIVFHVSDLAFSVLVPSGHPDFSLNPLDNYNFINHAVKEAVKDFLKFSKSPSLLFEEERPLDESCQHFCMAKPTRYDVMIEGRKVAGAAQRRSREGYLHQGTIAIALPEPDFLKGLFLPGTQIEEAMRRHTFSLLKSPWTRLELIEVRQTLKTLLTRHLTKES